MNDKQIINGIDVSECEYINCCSKKAKCIILQDDILSDSQYCESEANCYFKQLKRLQEENKRLQMLSCANCGEKYLSPDGAELYDKNVQLQKENEELKNRLKTLDEEEFVYEVTEIEYNNFKKMNKYKQALEEINILAKNYCNACDEFKAKTYKNKNDCLYCNYGFIKRKINEALNDRD